MFVKLLLLFLLHLILAALTSAALHENDTGQRFLVVYPETIAYYHPLKPTLLTYITPLYDYTSVTFVQSSFSESSKVMKAAEPQKVAFDAKLELGKTEVSNKVLEIKSNSTITVQALNLKGNSMQSAVVIPTNKLSNKFFIPPVPKIEGTNEPANIVTTNVTERNPFRLIIVSVDQETNVKLEGETTMRFTLESKQVRQVWLEDQDGWKTVTADKPVAVIFGHPCAIRRNCICGALYTTLPPAEDQNLKFIVPPDMAEEGETFVLLSKEDSTKTEQFKEDSPELKDVRSAVLYRPGLLLTLIPENDFASCYAVTSIPEDNYSFKTFASILVHKDFTSGVHFGKEPLNVAWTELKGSDYVSARVDLLPGKNAIWHNSTKMAVYYGGTKDDVLFGNPAPVISSSPDFRGCAVVPEVVHVGEVADGWRESLKYCSDKNLEMITLSNPKLRVQIYPKVREKNGRVEEVWIGMRRSSYTGNWYWVSGMNASAGNWDNVVTDADWGQGEPGKVNEGQCGIMTVEKNLDFDWGDEECCKDVHPVCYKEPYILPMNQ